MKKNIIIILLLINYTLSFSQDKIKTFSINWEIENNYCNFIKAPTNYSFNLANSFSSATNFKFGVKTGKVTSIISGISFAMNTISSNLRFDNSNDITEINILQENTYYENNFSFKSIGLPFLIQFRSSANKKNKFFTFETGYKLNILVSDKYSISTKTGNIITAVNEINNENVNNFQHSILGQINIRKYKICDKNKIGISLFLHYEQSLSNLFSKNTKLNLGYNVFGFGVGLFFE